MSPLTPSKYETNRDRVLISQKWEGITVASARRRAEAPTGIHSPVSRNVEFSWIKSRCATAGTESIVGTDPQQDLCLCCRWEMVYAGVFLTKRLVCCVMMKGRVWLGNIHWGRQSKKKLKYNVKRKYSCCEIQKLMPLRLKMVFLKERSWGGSCFCCI